MNALRLLRVDLCDPVVDAVFVEQVVRRDHDVFGLSRNPLRAGGFHLVLIIRAVFALIGIEQLEVFT